MGRFKNPRKDSKFTILYVKKHFGTLNNIILFLSIIAKQSIMMIKKLIDSKHYSNDITIFWFIKHIFQDNDAAAADVCIN